MEYNTFMAAVQVPAEVKEVEISSLYEALKQVKDKRGQRGRRYTAAVVLTLLVLAKLAGAVKLSGMAEWLELRSAMLVKRLHPFFHLIPP